MANEEILSLKIKDNGTIYDEHGHTVTQEGGTTVVSTVDTRQCMYFNIFLSELSKLNKIGYINLEILKM